MHCSDAPVYVVYYCALGPVEYDLIRLCSDVRASLCLQGPGSGLSELIAPIRVHPHDENILFLLGGVTCHNLISHKIALVSPFSVAILAQVMVDSNKRQIAAGTTLTRV